MMIRMNYPAAEQRGIILLVVNWFAADSEQRETSSRSELDHIEIKNLS